MTIDESYSTASTTVISPILYNKTTVAHSSLKSVFITTQVLDIPLSLWPHGISSTWVVICLYFNVQLKQCTLCIVSDEEGSAQDNTIIYVRWCNTVP